MCSIRPLSCLVPALLLALIASPAHAAPPLRAEGRFFRDMAGRAVMLRGVNVAGSSKVPPFTAAKDPAIFDPLPGWGLNTVRLLFTWEAYEPSEGTYDNDYIEYYVSAIRAAWARGLYVIVDFHQDAFSRFSVDGCGEGFPVWALPPDIPPDTPDNGPACASWGVKMQNDAEMLAAWDAFHADTYGAKTRYLAMLESVSTRLSDEPGVIGYDVMNEPWGDEATVLSLFHEQAAAAVRGPSPDAILFVSPAALTSAGKQTALLEPSFQNFAYSPHFYDASVVLFDSWSGYEPDEPFSFMNGKAAEWNAPLFLGEFGAPGPAENGLAYVDMLYRRLDEGLTSGAQWVYSPDWSEEKKDGWNDEDFSIVDGQGRLRDNFRIRPFPAKVAGTPTLFRVTVASDPKDSQIELSWDADPEAGATEIFVPREAFFGSAPITIETTGEGLSCALTGMWATCVSETAGAKRAVLRRAPSEAPISAGCAVARPAHSPSPIGWMLFLGALAALSRNARRPRGCLSKGACAPRRLTLSAGETSDQRRPR